MNVCRILCAVGASMGMAIAISSANAAPTVWTGPFTSFSKPVGADWTLPQHQDQLTASVVLTRGDTQGMFNIAQEASFGATSPADTAWATDVNNPGKTIVATNWAALGFTNWVAAYGGSVGPNIVGRSAVVHLISDDVYLDVAFTSYQGGGSGGAFAYRRTTPVPEPATAVLAAATLLVAGRLRRRGRRGIINPARGILRAAGPVRRRESAGSRAK